MMKINILDKATLARETDPSEHPDTREAIAIGRRWMSSGRCYGCGVEVCHAGEYSDGNGIVRGEFVFPSGAYPGHYCGNGICGGGTTKRVNEDIRVEAALVARTYIARLKRRKPPYKARPRR